MGFPFPECWRRLVTDPCLVPTPTHSTKIGASEPSLLENSILIEFLLTYNIFIVENMAQVLEFSVQYLSLVATTAYACMRS